MSRLRACTRHRVGRVLNLSAGSMNLFPFMVMAKFTLAINDLTYSQSAVS